MSKLQIIADAELSTVAGAGDVAVQNINFGTIFKNSLNSIASDGSQAGGGLGSTTSNTAGVVALFKSLGLSSLV